MRCTLVNAGGTDAQEVATWADNYMCVPLNSTISFQWSMSGPVAGKTCVWWKEPCENASWDNKYLCY